MRAKALVLLIGAALLAGAVALVLALDPRPPFADLPFALPWFALIPAYVATSRFTIDFEFRKEARSITLSQLPLAIGVVFLGPVWHLASRVTAELISTVALRRQPPMKVLFNVGNSAATAPRRAALAARTCATARVMSRLLAIARVTRSSSSGSPRLFHQPSEA